MCLHSTDMDNVTFTLICVCKSVIYTAATGSLCTSISNTGRLDPVWSLHSVLFSYKTSGKMPPNLLPYLLLLLMAKNVTLNYKCGSKKFPHEHISTYNMWVKKNSCIFHKYCFKNTFLLYGRDVLYCHLELKCDHHKTFRTRRFKIIHFPQKINIWFLTP